MHFINSTIIPLTLIALALLTPPASCFLFPSSSSKALSKASFIKRIKSIPQKHSTILLRSTSKDDEIAQLEAKLAQLKQEKELETIPTPPETEEPIPTPTNLENIDDEQRSIASNLKNQVPLDEMLSESWKEDEVDESNGIIGSLVSLLALVVGFVVLAQIPIGQEGLDKYSTAKPSTSIDLGDKNPINKSYDF